MSISTDDNIRQRLIHVLFFSALTLFTIFRMIDIDLWFHMRTGKLILETGSFIYNDIFSYTAYGREWLYHEWLFGVISFLIYDGAGVNGLIIAKASVLLLTFIILFRTMKLRGVNDGLAYLILIIAVSASRFRFTERPHIFKFLFITSFIYVLDLYRLKGRNHLWILVPVQILWANMHGSFIIGPMLIFIYLLSDILSVGQKFNKNLSLLLLVSILATMINPYGFRLILFAVGFGHKTFLPSLTEWQPTKLVDFYGAYGMLFMIGVMSFFAIIADIKRKKIDLSDILIFCLFSALSLKAIRFTALFSLVSAPLIAGNLSYLKDRMAASESLWQKLRSYSVVLKWVVGSCIAGIVLLIAVHEFKRHPLLEFGLGEGKALPVKAVDFLDRIKVEGNMYNSFAFGGYLIWRGYPDRKVFVDGRPEIYPPDFQESFIAKTSLSAWDNAIVKYDINYAVIAYSSGNLDHIGSLIAKESDWVLIYWDDVSRIYIRDHWRNKHIIDAFGHSVIKNPLDFNDSSIEMALGKGLADKLETELAADIRSNQENFLAANLLASLYYKTGRKDDAVRAWSSSISIRPDANIYNNIGNVFMEKGVYQKAVEYYNMSIEKDRGFAESYYNAGNAYQALNRTDEAHAAYEKFLELAGPEYADVAATVRKRIKTLE